MLFGKKKSKSVAIKPIEPAAPAADIHIMPERFYVAPAKHHTGLILTIIAVVVIVGGGAAAYIWLSQYQPAPTPVAVTNQNQPINIPPVNQPIEPIPTEIEPGTSTPLLATSTPVVATSTEPTPPAPTVSYFRAPDNDNDGLSAAEESMYGTDSSAADSDGDTFTDANELQNGYDPRQAQQTLAAGSLFGSYDRSSIVTFQYPLRWTNKVATSGDIESLSPLGEGVRITVVQNTNQAALRAWLTQTNPTASQDILIDVTTKYLTGLRASDGLTYYLTSPTNDRIIVAQYIAGSGQQLNFVTTFSIMIASLQLLP